MMYMLCVHGTFNIDIQKKVLDFHINLNLYVNRIHKCYNAIFPISR